jgi:Uma2 family endonuclease
MSVQPIQRWTPAEYLAFERAHSERHEFIDGRIVRQAGGSRNHALIGTNIVGSLHQQLRSRTCTVYSSDMRVSILHAQRYVYPDASVVCGEASFDDEHEDSLNNPTSIIEILSPSTERYDRGKKFQAYQTSASFQEYLLIAQDAVMIEHFTRQSDKLWTFDVVTDRTASITLTSIQCTLHVEDIYEKVALPTQDDTVDTAIE